MISDPIADMLTTIKNGYMAKKEVVRAPSSEFKKKLLKKLVDLEYIKSVIVDDSGKKIDIELLYRNSSPGIVRVKRISKPSLRVYVSKKRLPKVSLLSTIILSTPAGLLTAFEARGKGVGGEVICEVW
ncbi:MAG: 30S ribosomal protein S8 [Candidatus Woykebacteria bacterium RIFCSPHIGHO2_01_FULL_39_12]|uniref:Small ribosomal subunit protein uS8 n=1 Tax=Candidatus Woykebacteria bacterium RIFCSPHIGHO2_01_FULL_39_12 TaxID=1802599 RepID=A0A1G1WHP3_9BACT|nr:MAG: 30S ribosomal protein S8 [Candidatus Woykebacteria bacterium RIFCSPHIGHO2_01_FULL_39_12]